MTLSVLIGKQHNSRKGTRECLQSAQLAPAQSRSCEGRFHPTLSWLHPRVSWPRLWPRCAMWCPWWPVASASAWPSATLSSYWTCSWVACCPSWSAASSSGAPWRVELAQVSLPPQPCHCLLSAPLPQPCMTPVPLVPLHQRGQELNTSAGRP